MSIFTFLQATPATPSPTPTGSTSAFFNYLDVNRNGIFVLLLCFLVAVLLVQWVAWISASGRFKLPKSPLTTSRQNLRYLLAEVAAKIIDEFRHLLALVIVVIFAFTLTFVLIQTRRDIGMMKEGLQVVVATLGGLVGSLIGYYFGESTAVRAMETGTPAPAPPGPPPAAVQGPPLGDVTPSGTEGIDICAAAAARGARLDYASR